MKKYNSKSNKTFHRSQSLCTMTPFSTIAQFNKVSNKINQPIYNTNKPLRILLPQFFNVPVFVDNDIQFNRREKQLNSMKFDGSLKRRMKDLSLLAEGMKRAKNIKQQSRYYYIQGVLMHNFQHYTKAIEYFDRFLKIVLFLKDEKSIELVLNCIGNSFMYLNDPLKAIEYHQKQIQIVSNADKFVGRINIGLCYEMMRDYQSAYSQYQIVQKENEQEGSEENKVKHINQLINRVERNILLNEDNDNAFITENLKNKRDQLLKRRQSQQENSKILYLEKMESSPTRRQYQNAKIGYAVCRAQQKLHKFINSMRESYAQSPNSSYHQ